MGLILIYGGIYYAIYVTKPSSFVFNSEIKEKNYREYYLLTKERLENEILPGFRRSVDTIKQNDGTIVISHLSQYMYLIGKDTVFIRDSNEIPAKTNELIKMEEQNQFSSVWKDLDFVYFSAITISTVGYGDILPNSTTVRMVVVSEVILGQFLLIVFLNLVLTDISKKEEKTL
jgi:hypothetical protein